MQEDGKIKWVLYREQLGAKVGTEVLLFSPVFKESSKELKHFVNSEMSFIYLRP